MKNEFSTLSSELQLNAESIRAKYLDDGFGSSLEKNRSLMRFMSRQEFAKVLAYTDLFSMTRGIIGSIADCGVFLGGGLATYANLAASLEPYNYQCKIIGFDTFQGNQGITEQDKLSKVDFSEQLYQAENFLDLKKYIEIYDMDRPLNHIQKIELVVGDIRETSKQYIQNNQEALFRIVHLSINLYEPTVAAIENLVPRLSNGGVMAIHALNCSSSPTLAALNTLRQLGYTDLRFKCFDFYPNISYWVKE